MGRKGNPLNENEHLIEENNRLKARPGITESEPSKNSITKSTAQNTFPDEQSTGSASFPAVNTSSDSISKIKLFMSLFKGREDVFASRWENKKFVEGDVPFKMIDKIFLEYYYYRYYLLPEENL